MKNQNEMDCYSIGKICICIVNRIFFFIFFLMLFSNICNGKYCCKINDGVEYLYTVSFIKLRLNDNDVFLPIPCEKYAIPDINSISISKCKVGKELNICPPVALIDGLSSNESCLMQEESVSN